MGPESKRQKESYIFCVYIIITNVCECEGSYANDGSVVVIEVVVNKYCQIDRIRIL